MFSNFFHTLNYDNGLVEDGLLGFDHVAGQAGETKVLEGFYGTALQVQRRSPSCDLEITFFNLSPEREPIPGFHCPMNVKVPITNDIDMSVVVSLTKVLLQPLLPLNRHQSW
jgi:hypothetical protein